MESESELKLSVIIPYYNASQYISRVFHALDKQTYRNFEVIIIDDGSSDDSLKVVQQLCSSRSYCKVYSFENAGPSTARNRGISLASGEYLYFLDADDYFLPELFEEMVGIIPDYGFPDDIRFGYQWFNGNFDVENHPPLPKASGDIKVFEGDDITHNLLGTVIGYSTKDVESYYKLGTWPVKGAGYSVWSHFYKRSTIEAHNIRFAECLIMGEDRIFNSTFMAFAKKVVCVDKDYYYYISSEQGILNTILKLDINRLYYEKKTILEQREVVRQLYLNEKNIYIFETYRGSSVIAAIQLAIAFSGHSFFRGYCLYSKFLAHPLLKNALDGFLIKNAPLKFKVPMLMIKYHLSGLLFFLLWGGQKVGLKLDKYR